MEAQKQYDFSLYIILQLIFKRKYKRAIAIAQHLQSQGFMNNELATLKSYALWKCNGAKIALDSISYYDGPLINFAKSQYCQSIKNWNQSQNYLQKLKDLNQKSPIDNLLHSAKQQKGEFLQPIPIHQNITLFPCPQQKCIEQMNKITLSYQNIKKSGNQNITSQQLKILLIKIIQKYRNVLVKYQPSKKIQEVICQFVLYIQKQLK